MYRGSHVLHGQLAVGTVYSCVVVWWKAAVHRCYSRPGVQNSPIFGSPSIEKCTRSGLLPTRVLYNFPAKSPHQTQRTWSSCYRLKLSQIPVNWGCWWAQLQLTRCRHEMRWFNHESCAQIVWEITKLFGKNPSLISLYKCSVNHHDDHDISVYRRRSTLHDHLPSTYLVRPKGSWRCIHSAWSDNVGKPKVTVGGRVV